MMSLPEASLVHLTESWKHSKRVILLQDSFCLDSTKGQLDPAISLCIYPGIPCVFRNGKECTFSNALFSGGRALLLNRQLFLLRAYLVLMSYKAVWVYITMALALIVHKMLHELTCESVLSYVIISLLCSPSQVSCCQIGISPQPNRRAGEQSRVSSCCGRSVPSYTKWFSKSVHHRSEAVWQVCMMGGKQAVVYY